MARAVGATMREPAVVVVSSPFAASEITVIELPSATSLPKAVEKEALADAVGPAGPCGPAAPGPPLSPLRPRRPRGPRGPLLPRGPRWRMCVAYSGCFAAETPVFTAAEP